MSSIPLVLSIASSLLFSVLLPFRLSKLSLETLKTLPRPHHYIKLAIPCILLTLQSIELAVAALQALPGQLVILSRVTSFTSYIGLCVLLSFEHIKSIRPSDLAIFYVLTSLSCDAAELLIQYHRHETFMFPIPVAGKACLKFLLLVVESQNKRDLLLQPYSALPPEQLAGPLSRTFLWWILPIMIRGYHLVLTNETLPPIDHNLASESLRYNALKAWNERARPENRFALPRALARSMLFPFLAPILPRLFLITFRYAQPFLINYAVRHIDGSIADQMDTGQKVILMGIIVYVGLATSKVLYQHSLNRLQVMTRGATVGLINKKSLRQQSTRYDDGRAVALMSTDAESIANAAQIFHEVWAQAIEVILGTTMLASEVGWICVVPLVIIFFCSRVSQFMARNLQTQQKDWNVATQNRLAMTASTLASMKSLKMIGAVADAESLVQTLRIGELQKAQTVRWMMVAYNASANALGIFSPIVTFALFAVLSHWKGAKLSTETAFTTIALLGLVTHPANMIMSIVPQAVSSLAAFDRIRQYLLEPSRHDPRIIARTDERRKSGSPFLSVADVTVTGIPGELPLLKDINLEVERGAFVICSGPVGSGKTTLLKVLIGEHPLARGNITFASLRIAYCDQTPWLPSGTIKDAICSYSRIDQSWYEEVVRLCCLEDDILSLPKGDSTMIGSRGLNLSGGQRQRVALARAVYARHDFVILDDPISALDVRTGARIMDNLLGFEGHFRQTKTTVILTANSRKHFHLADWLIILRDGVIEYQGTCDEFPEKSDELPEQKELDPLNHQCGAWASKNDTFESQRLKVAEAATDIDRATGDISLYGVPLDYYLRSAGLANVAALVTCTALYSFFVTIPQFWLQKWTEAPQPQTMFYVGGYLILSIIAWTSTNGSMWSTHILIAAKSGTELHRRLLCTVFGASLSFFSMTDTGVILNRFSQDIQLIDRQLPPALLSICNQVFKLFMQAALLFAAQKLMALTFPLCVIVVYFIQKIYLRTSRQLRLLDLESQSAIYSSFLESVEGLTTIRAFGWEKDIEDANTRALNTAQQPAYLLLCLQQWLSVVLDLVIAAIATSLIALAVLIGGSTSAAQIGMALNIVIVANATLLGLVTSWTNLEISLGAISRLKILEADTPAEEKLSETYVPLDNWPSSGAVKIDNVTVAYNYESTALDKVDLTFSGGQQAIICGRTGSGKSTLLTALLGLVDLNSGVIKVDGIDLSRVPKSLIRQRCFITVAQDSFILGQATLKFNLDPSTTLADEALIAALERTHLWSQFSSGLPASMSLKARRILNCPIASLPQMSVGQTQMFALARALLRIQALNRDSTLRNVQLGRPRIMPVILLDEATSSVDPETEADMRNIIYQEFTEKGHTVIAVAHRMDGMIDYVRIGQDVVVQLTNGRIDRIDKVEDVLGLEL